MADNFTIPISGGGTVNLRSKEISAGLHAVAKYVLDGHDEALGATTDTPATVADATSFSLMAIAKALFNFVGAVGDAAATAGSTGSISAKLRNLTATSNSTSTALGAPADEAVTNPSLSANVIAALKGILTGVNALGKAEDAAHSSGDVGAFMLGVRRDTLSASSGTDGDYTGLAVDSSGRAYVFDDQANGSLANLDLTLLNLLNKTAQSYAEDAPHTSGDVGTMALAVRKDTATALAGADGDYTPMLVDALGRQHVNVGTSVLPTNAAQQDTLTAINSATGTTTDAAVDFDANGSLHARHKGIHTTLNQVLAAATSELPIGTKHIGTVGGHSPVIQFTPTIQTSEYASGDVLFDTMAVAAARTTDKGVIVTGLTLTDKNNQGAAMTLWFFRSNVSLGTINSAPSISAANLKQLVARVVVKAGDWVTLASMKVAFVNLVETVGGPFNWPPASGSANCYIAATVDQTETWAAADDLVINAHVLQD